MISFMHKNFIKYILTSSQIISTKSIGFLLLILTLIPGALRDASYLACLGQVSNKTWRESNNHSIANVTAVRYCNGND